jgi:hypothetical protein
VLEFGEAPCARLTRKVKRFLSVLEQNVCRAPMTGRDDAADA